MANTAKTAETTAEVKDVETKDAKFKRLATVRMNNLITVFDKLEGLSNKGIYDYTPEQVEKMVSVIRARADRLERALNSGKAKTSDFGF